mgnify:CR=1 FL=1
MCGLSSITWRPLSLGLSWRSCSHLGPERRIGNMANGHCNQQFSISSHRTTFRSSSRHVFTNFLYTNRRIFSTKYYVTLCNIRLSFLKCSKLSRNAFFGQFVFFFNWEILVKKFIDSYFENSWKHVVNSILVVATLNELHFWDWSLPDPFCKVATKSDKEKVRYVKFDSMGHHLVTGIANLTNNGVGGRNHNYSSNRLSQQRAMARARRPPMYPNPNSRLVL